MTTVSVIIPTYNRREVLTRALGSVLGQTQPPHEVWVVDDGSTDGTAQMLASQYPDVRVIMQENRGVSAARNAATSPALALAMSAAIRASSSSPCTALPVVLV